jgi:hypothetical protein
MPRKIAEVMEVVEMPRLPMRGYSLCDDDWREYPLRLLRPLWGHEGELLAILEDQETELYEEEWTKINQDLDNTVAEINKILDSYVRPVAYRWWTTDDGRRFI